VKCCLRLLWLKAGPLKSRAFKLPGAAELTAEYARRLEGFSDFQILGKLSKGEERKPGRVVWFCDRGQGSKILSSEDAAEKMGQVLDAGVHELHVVIGGPDGFSREDETLWKPAVKWSFGTFTLPHELAAVVAAEQLYRAFTILKKHPYHGGH